ncbi:MAG: hypothetical protein JO183_06275 [Ktedonobacteraceae bacterium]|nr:hypothetical protein [Ktedonobacteraceae bacterium]
MFKINIKKLLLLLCCSIGLLSLGVVLHAQEALAAAYGPTPQVTITQPNVSNAAVGGHAGTKVQIVGIGFAPIPTTVQLFTTTNADPAHCQPGDPNLTMFTTQPTVMINGPTWNVNTVWPDNAAVPGNVYYVCALSLTNQVLSSNTFTAAQPVMVNVSPTSVAQGAMVTVTGMNWLPPQQLNVSITSGDNGPAIVSSVVNSDAAGNFTTSLAIPGNARPMAYSVRVYALNENTPAMTKVLSNALTVMLAPTPTPTAAPTPTPLPTTPVATATPPGGTGTSTGGIMANTFLLFGLAGLGILLVIVGIILFVMYSRKS